MRAAVARYVEEIHRAYLAQAMTFPAAVRGGMPLLAPGPLTVAAVGVRHLHLLATRDLLGRGRRRPGWCERTPCWLRLSRRTTRLFGHWPAITALTPTPCGGSCWPRSGGGRSGSLLRGLRRDRRRGVAGRAVDGAERGAAA